MRHARSDPYGALGRHQVEALGSVYAKDATTRVGQLAPGVLVAIAQSDIGKALCMPVHRAWQAFELVEPGLGVSVRRHWWGFRR